VIFYIINTYKKKEFYYYLNIGISKRKLWGLTILFDFLLFLIAINLGR
jgi:hypothetical protein